MSTETWTLIIALITLLVTLGGWIYTGIKQKQLLERQISAERERDSWQQLAPARIQELREMKRWLEDGLKFLSLKPGEKTETLHVEKWLSQSRKFLIMAKRVDSTIRSDIDDTLYGNVWIFTIMVNFINRKEQRDFDNIDRENLREAETKWVPSAINRLEELIEQTATEKPKE